MKVFAETDRLILRELTNNDLEGMFQLDSDARVHQFLGKRPIQDKADAQRYIDHTRTQYQKYGIGRWAAIEKETGEFIGWSGLKMNDENQMNGHINFVDVGYRFIPKFWGKGYATESGKAAVAYGFEKMNYDTIYGMAELEHKASRKALENIGLKYVQDFIYEAENIPLAWYEIRNDKKS
ncbi:GNAT family N-acetyltransferase [Spongiivirga sp. MCCC 1A20706]|uniref:GNAT family N-acetyltransferase n=1 Tax=Spongiivirga sp. MCCC 1A20706 TaxID=3160963 RepID=UPI003977A617